MKRIQLMITSSCNSTCSYCMSKDITGDETQIDPSFLDKIDFTRLLLFGGEPLLYKDLCDKFRDYALSRNLEIVLPTNGLLLTEEIIEQYPRILISSNGTKESSELTRQPYIPKLLSFEHKEKCCIGLRIIPETADRLYIDFRYFWDAGYRLFNIAPIAENDWDDSALNSYRDNIIKILQDTEQGQVWNWRCGGICVPYNKTYCIDQFGEEWACARYYSEKIRIKRIPEKYFQKCLKCDNRDYCYFNCHYLNLIKTGTMVMPYPTVCKFAQIHREATECTKT
ncbi:MAG: radical SAM protein [Negativicutes bacterium]|nr:radical SAM protein [Negativicutes bacterium]